MPHSTTQTPQSQMVAHLPSSHIQEQSAMFDSYAQYEAAAKAVLADKAKGTGYSNGTGVVFLLCDELFYAPEGAALQDCYEGDVSAWEEHSNRAEFKALQNPVFVVRFTPAEVEAYEAALNN